MLSSAYVGPCTFHMHSSMFHYDSCARPNYAMSPILYTLDLSPPARAVYMTAKSIGITLEHRFTDFFKGEHLEPFFIELNPKHTIPTLVDGDLIITDSHAITAYLVGKYAGDDSLCPKDVSKRALVDEMLHFDSSIAFPSLLNIGVPLRLKLTNHVPEDKVKKTKEAYSFLEKYLKGKDWVSLDHYTIADFHLVATITSIDVFVPIADYYPNITDWIGRCKKLDFYSENIKGLEDFEKYFSPLME